MSGEGRRSFRVEDAFGLHARAVSKLVRYTLAVDRTSHALRVRVSKMTPSHLEASAIASPR